MDPDNFLEVSDEEWVEVDEEQKATNPGNPGSQGYTDPSPSVEVAWQMLLNERQLQIEESKHSRGIEQLKEQYGEDHLSTIESIKQLAHRYMHREDFKDAEVIFVRLLDLAQNKFGPEDLYLSELVFDAGMAFCGQLRLLEARKFLERFVQSGRQLLNKSSKWTIAGYPSSAFEPDALAAISEKLEYYLHQAESLLKSMETLPQIKEPHEAADLLRRVGRETPARLFKTKDGEGFKDLALSFGKLDVTVGGIKRQSVEYVNDGRWTKAEEYISFVLSLHERILGSEHEDSLAILDLFASFCENRGQWADAERHRTKLATLIRKKRGERDPDAFLVETLAARSAAKQGNERAEEAREMLQGAIDRAAPVLSTIFRLIGMPEVKDAINTSSTGQAPSRGHSQELRSKLIEALRPWGANLNEPGFTGESHSGSSTESGK
ncbi:hypothetical protein BDZ45DRAFT_732843 [Acephala macrosclerotiorum]|nr:hypothetical protein BDZ45DRAFT_732843 [Acephala macrosclerotiorum]